MAVGGYFLAIDRPVHSAGKFLTYKTGRASAPGADVGRDPDDASFRYGMLCHLGNTIANVSRYGIVITHICLKKLAETDLKPILE